MAIRLAFAANAGRRPMTRIALAVLAVTALASAAPGPDQAETDDVVQKARTYVDQWQTELSGLVASEETPSISRHPSAVPRPFG